jgi:hypothetical protein
MMCVGTHSRLGYAIDIDRLRPHTQGLPRPSADVVPRPDSAGAVVGKARDTPREGHRC